MKIDRLDRLDMEIFSWNEDRLDEKAHEQKYVNFASRVCIGRACICNHAHVHVAIKQHWRFLTVVTEVAHMLPTSPASRTGRATGLGLTTQRVVSVVKNYGVLQWFLGGQIDPPGVFGGIILSLRFFKYILKDF